MIDITDYKKVWEPGAADQLIPMLFPTTKAVYRPFTEVEPPVGDDVLITGFDWNTLHWKFEQIVPPAKYEALEQGFMEMAEIVSSLIPDEPEEEEDDADGELLSDEDSE